MAIRFITPDENESKYDNYSAVFTLKELTNECLEKLLADPILSVFFPEEHKQEIRKQFNEQIKNNK